MKVINSSENIQRYGRLNFIFNTLQDSGILSLIKDKQGKRSCFQYDDIFSNQLALLFAGGDCAEDLQVHLKKDLQLVKNLKPCSADTLLHIDLRQNPTIR